MNTTFQTMSGVLKPRKIQYIAACCVLLVFFGYGYFHASKGISFREEGGWFASSLSYTLGNLPFRDELVNTIRLSDVLFSPVFMIYPELSLLQARYIGLTVQIVSILVIFVFLSRYAPPVLVALACSAAFLLHDNDGRFQFHNTLTGAFSVFSLICWLYACTSKQRRIRILFSLVGGMFLALTILGYNPKILLLCVPLVALILSIFSIKQRQIFLWPSLILTGIFAIFIIMSLIVMIFSGLWSDYVNAIGMFVNRMTAYATQSETLVVERSILRILGQLFAFPLGLFHRFLRQPYILQGVGIMGALFMVLSLGVGLLFMKGLSKSKRLVFVLVVIVFLYAVFPLPVKLKIHSFSFLLAFLSLFFNENNHSASYEESIWNLIRNYAISWGVVEAVACGLSSGSSSALRSIVVLFVVSMVALYRFVNYSPLFGDVRSLKRRVCVVLVYIMPIPFIVAGLNYNDYKYLYRIADVTTDNLTAQFTHPKLKGMYSTPEKVAVVEELLRYLDEKVKPNDDFLVSSVAPLLYYLTHTKPAYRTYWPDFNWSNSIHERLIQEMVDRKRIPEYCVSVRRRLVHDWETPSRYKADFPLDAFVRANYQLEKTIFPFEIWHRQQGDGESEGNS